MAVRNIGMMMVAHGLLYAEGQCDRSVAFSLKIGVKQVKGEFRRGQGNRI